MSVSAGQEKLKIQSKVRQKSTEFSALPYAETNTESIQKARKILLPKEKQSKDQIKHVEKLKEQGTYTNVHTICMTRCFGTS